MTRLRRASLVFLLSLVTALALARQAGAQNPDPERYIVKFADSARGKSALAASGAAILLDLPDFRAAAARIPAQALQALRANPNIEYIEPDVPRYPLTETTPYGITMVQAPQVSDTDAGSRKVCIIDSGYSYGHEDLPQAHVSGDSDSSAGAWSQDGCGHGTHVAGTIAALDNGVGVIGVMPSGNINLHIVRVFNNSCTWAYSSSLINAAQKCKNAGANVISMSLGGTGASITERDAFQTLYNGGMLSIAAAGNSGNTAYSYPASYPSVISVAAVDSAKVAASFSQRNDQVELAAPGVAVRSTVPMGTGTEESLTVQTQTYEVVGMQGTPNASGTGPLVDCGLGTSTCPGGGGQVCLIQRGTNTFANKVLNCQAGGGTAAVIYNNSVPLFSGTLNGTVTTIPSVGTSGDTGAILKGRLGQTSTVTTGPGNYAFYDGTSMATPHVSAVAALVWSHNTAWSNQQVRDALDATAQDLGASGRDTTYGWGLVQAKAALDYLVNNGGGGTPPPPPPPPPGTITLSASGYKVKGVESVNLSWSGASSGSVDIFRNGVQITTTANDGAYTDALGTKGKGTFTYQVCEAGTTTCSNSATVVF